MEYAIQRCTRRCAVTGRELAPGEIYYSALVEQGGSPRRLDYSAEAWIGPPEGAIGWWRSHLPAAVPDRPQPASNEQLLEVFEDLQEKPERAELRYLLALLLVRRRLFRVEEQRRDPEGQEVLVLYCPRCDTRYQVPVVPPAPARTEALQDELVRLVGGLRQPAAAPVSGEARS